jgi:glycosyltransferase involved in cell wall biosynthesis
MFAFAEISALTRSSVPGPVAKMPVYCILQLPLDLIAVLAACAAGSRVRDTRDARIVIPGAIYGEGYHELGSHCFAYIHATTVGGTHPALIEAMGRGALVLYRNTPENAEVAGDAGIPFESDELAEKLRAVIAMSEADREALRRKAMDRVRERYSWDAVTDAYERLLQGLG